MDSVSPKIFSQYFSAFSTHSIVFHGMLYKTVEHAYHAQRYADKNIVQEIVSSPTPADAWQISQLHKAKQISNFNEQKLSIMEALFRAKLEQHPDVRDALLATNNLLIIKHEPKDSWWGDGPDIVIESV